MFKLDIIDNSNLKITYLGDKTINTVIYCFNPWDIVTDKCTKQTFNTKGHWIIYNFDIKNKSKLVIRAESINYEFILPFKIEKEKNNKIICCGLNKTGTTSLAKDLKSLKLKQFPENIGHQFLSESVINGSYGKLIDSIENIDYDFYEDMPFSLPKVYEKIFNFFPNEKYILTIRNNPEEWVNSCINFYGEHIKTDIESFSKIGSYNHVYSDFGNYKVYNWIYPLLKSWNFNMSGDLKKNLKDVYEKHNNDFIDFMEKNNGDYIVINVAKKGELKKLSNWLGIENNKEDFVWTNKTKNK